MNIRCISALLLLLLTPCYVRGGTSIGETAKNGGEQFATVSVGDFFAIVETLAETEDMSILCESVPVTLHPSPKQAEMLSASLNEKSLSSKERIQQVSSIFDYDPYWITTNLCIWRKKFSHQTDGQEIIVDDVPEVTMAEAIRSLKNIRTLYKAFPTPTRLGGGAVALVKNIDLDTIKTLESNDKPIAELPLLMQPYLRQMAVMQIPGEALRSVESVGARLRVCQQSNIALGYQSFLTVEVPVYKGSIFKVNGKLSNAHIALSGVIYTGPRSGSSYPLLPAYIREAKNADDLAAEYIRSEMKLSSSEDTNASAPQVRTLQQVVSSLRDTWNDSAPLIVDPDVATKRVCVFNGGKAPPAKIAQAVAAIYGLQYAKVRTTKGRPPAWNIAPYPLRQNVPLEGISHEVIKQIPSPLYRSIMNTEPSTDFNWNPTRDKKMRAMYSTAMARMRSVATKELKDSVGKDIPLSHIEKPVQDEFKDGIAQTSMLSLMPTLLQLATPLSPHLIHLDKSVPKVKVEKRPAENGNSPGYNVQYTFQYNDGIETSGSGGYVRFPFD